MTQGLPYPVCQILSGEGLVNKVYALVQHPMVGDDIGGVTRYEQTFHVRMKITSAALGGVRLALLILLLKFSFKYKSLSKAWRLIKASPSNNTSLTLLAHQL